MIDTKKWREIAADSGHRAAEAVSEIFRADPRLQQERGRLNLQAVLHAGEISLVRQMLAARVAHREIEKALDAMEAAYSEYLDELKSAAPESGAHTSDNHPQRSQ